MRPGVLVVLSSLVALPVSAAEIADLPAVSSSSGTSPTLGPEAGTAAALVASFTAQDAAGRASLHDYGVEAATRYRSLLLSGEVQPVPLPKSEADPTGTFGPVVLGVSSYEFRVAHGNSPVLVTVAPAERPSERKAFRADDPKLTALARAAGNLQQSLLSRHGTTTEQVMALGLRLALKDLSQAKEIPAPPDAPTSSGYQFWGWHKTDSGFLGLYVKGVEVILEVADPGYHDLGWKAASDPTLGAVSGALDRLYASPPLGAT